MSSSTQGGRGNRKVAIIAIAAAVLLVAGVWIVRAVTPSSGEQVAQRAQTLLDGFLRADPAAIDELVDTGSSPTTRTLTREGAAKAFGENPSYTITERTVEDREVTLTAKIDSAPEATEVQVKLEQNLDNGPWEVQRLPLPRAAVSTQSDLGTATVNGVEVQIPRYSSVTVILWPGQSTFSSPGMTTVERTFTATLRAPELYERIDAAEVKLAPEPLSAQQLIGALEKNLSSCLGPGDVANVACPFSPPAPPAGANGVRNVAFSDLRFGDGDDRYETWDESNPERSTSKSGTVKVTGQFKVGDTWKDFSSRTNFVYDFALGYGKDGLEVTSASDAGYDSASVANDRAWSLASTDQGSSREQR